MVLTSGGEYGLYVASTGYLFKNENYNYEEKEEFEPELLDIYLDPLKAGRTAVLNNIFFDYNKYELKEKSLVELKEVINLLKNNAAIRIEIGGHTDDVGSSKYNLELSLNRAKSVATYLMNNEINSDRIEIKGYGATNPLVPNDSDENRSKNRRIEFKIL